MKQIINYIKSFLQRDGAFVGLASILSKALSFITLWLVLKTVTEESLGKVIYAYNIIGFIIPFAGLGLQQTLIRFAPLLKTNSEKKTLLSQCFTWGTTLSLVITFLFLLANNSLDFGLLNTKKYLNILIWILIPLFVFEIQKAHLRLEYQNKKFALAEAMFHGVLLITAYGFTYKWKAAGYAYALVSTPTIMVFLMCFVTKMKGLTISKKYLIKKEQLSFGIYSSLSSVAAQLLVLIDILMLGWMSANATWVTQYKYISIVPLSLIVLPHIFISTDWVKITEQIWNKKHTKTYAKQYAMLFGTISLVTLGLSFFIAPIILESIKPGYQRFYKEFMILIIGVVAVIGIRGLYGNLLSAIGKANYNFAISGIGLLTNIVLNGFMIPKYGLFGAALTSSICMLTTAILSLIVFWKTYLNHPEVKTE